MTVQYGASTVTSEPFSKRTAGAPSSSTKRRVSGAARQSVRNWSRRSSKSVVPSGRRERIIRLHNPCNSRTARTPTCTGVQPTARHSVGTSVGSSPIPPLAIILQDRVDIADRVPIAGGVLVVHRLLRVRRRALVDRLKARVNVVANVPNAHATPVRTVSHRLPPL